MTTPSRSLTHTQLSRIGTSQKESRGAHINSYLISVGDDPRHAVLHFDSGSSIDFDCDPHTILNWIAPGRTVDTHTRAVKPFLLPFSRAARSYLRCWWKWVRHRTGGRGRRRPALRYPDGRLLKCQPSDGLTTYDNHVTLPIDERIGHQIKRAEQELIAVKNAVLRPAGLNVPQYTVLLVLAEEPGLSGAALARRCLVTPQTMSTVLNTLETKGLVSRQNHPVHTHIQEARLTRKGRAALTKADAAAVEVERELAKQFTDEERALLRELLSRCTDQLAVSLQRVKASRVS